MKSLFILLSLLILLESCKKNVSIESLKTESITSHEILSVSLSNPYDSVGIWHNKILNMVLPQINSIADTNLRKISGIVAACHYSTKQIDKATLCQYVKISIGGAPTNYMLLIDKCPISTFAKQYLHRLLTVVMDTTNYDNTEAMYITIKNNISALEHQSLTDKQLDANGQRYVLEIISIAHHSLDYWLPAGTQGLSLKKIVRAIATVTGDIGGAIEGYYTGDIVGTASEASAWWYENISWGMPEN